MKKKILLALSLSLIINPTSFASEETNQPVIEQEVKEEFLPEWENKSFEEIRDIEINKAKDNDGLINEAKKDLIVMLTRTSSKEDVINVLTNFNPQGVDYPTLKSKHNFTQNKDGGYIANINGKDYILDEFGNLKGGFSDEKSAKSIKSQYNALVAKFITDYEMLPVEKQADYQIIIENMRAATESDNTKDFKDVVNMHKEINNELMAVSKSELFNNSLADSNNSLDKFLNDDFSEYTKNNYDNKEEVKVKPKAVENTDNIKPVAEENTNPDQVVKTEVKTGVNSIYIVAVILVIAIIGYFITNKNKRKD